MRSNDLRTRPGPNWNRWHGKSRESVMMEILMGTPRLILDDVSHSDPLSISQDIGARLPVHATSTGKMLLAQSRLRSTRCILSRTAHASDAHTITDPRQFCGQLDEIRRQGYAPAVDELEIGFVSIAAPVSTQSI